MGLVPIVKFAFTWAIVNSIFIVLAPGIHYVFKQSFLWNLLPADVLAYGNIIYDFWIAQTIILPAGLIIFAWREAELRARQS